MAVFPIPVLHSFWMKRNQHLPPPSWQGLCHLEPDPPPTKLDSWPHPWLKLGGRRDPLSCTCKFLLVTHASWEYVPRPENTSLAFLSIYFLTREVRSPLKPSHALRRGVHSASSRTPVLSCALSLNAPVSPQCSIPIKYLNLLGVSGSRMVPQICNQGLEAHS